MKKERQNDLNKKRIEEKRIEERNEERKVKRFEQKKN